MPSTSGPTGAVSSTLTLSPAAPSCILLAQGCDARGIKGDAGGMGECSRMTPETDCLPRQRAQ